LLAITRTTTTTLNTGRTTTTNSNKWSPGANKKWLLQ